MKFKPSQDVTLNTQIFNFVRSIGCTAEPPKFGKEYKVAGYTLFGWHGKPTFMLVGFPSGIHFFEDTFDALPTLEEIAHDMGGDVSIIGRKE